MPAHLAGGSPHRARSTLPAPGGRPAQPPADPLAPGQPLAAPIPASREPSPRPGTGDEPSSWPTGRGGADRAGDAARDPAAARRLRGGRASRVDQAFSPLLPQLSRLVRSSVRTRSPTQRIVRSHGRPRPAVNTEIADFGDTLAATSRSPSSSSTSARRCAATEAAQATGRGGPGRRRAAAAAHHADRQGEHFTQLLLERGCGGAARRPWSAPISTSSRARGFFEVGTRPKSDVARAEVDVANARVDLIRARTPSAGPRRPSTRRWASRSTRRRRSRTSSSTSRCARPRHASAEALAPAARVQAGPAARRRGRGHGAAGLPRLLPRTSPLGAGSPVRFPGSSARAS